MWYLWLITAGIFFVVEMITTGFLVFWLGIGGLLAMITSFITENLFIQTAVFVVSSVLLILFTKPLVKKYIDTGKNTITNAYRIIGKTGLVTIDIDSVESTGQVKVNGELWTAKADTNIQKGTEVEILKIDGVKLVVTPKVKSLNNV